MTLRVGILGTTTKITKRRKSVRKGGLTQDNANETSAYVDEGLCSTFLHILPFGDGCQYVIYRYYSQEQSSLRDADRAPSEIIIVNATDSV